MKPSSLIYKLSSKLEFMGTIGQFQREKLVIAVLISKHEYRDRLLEELESCFGAIDYTSSPSTFDYSHYYDREMGLPIERFFVSHLALIEPSRLSETKTNCNRIEDLFRVGGNRRINLDPGLLCLSRFILASTKDSSHRIPLQAGIYAEITLMFEKGRFRPIEWTYPDYAGPEYGEILKHIRSLYQEQLQTLVP